MHFVKKKSNIEIKFIQKKCGRCSFCNVRTDMSYY